MEKLPAVPEGRAGLIAVAGGNRNSGMSSGATAPATPRSSRSITRFRSRTKRSLTRYESKGTDNSKCDHVQNEGMC